MTIFHHSFTDVENYPIVSLLSLIISFNNPTKDHPLHWGQRQRQRKIFLKEYKRLNVWCWKANVRKIEFQKTLSSPRRKNRSEQEQNKDNEKETKRNRELKKMKRMRDEWKDNEKWSFIKMILSQITLKYNLGLFILSFETINPGLHYVPENPFWSNVDI